MTDWRFVAPLMLAASGFGQFALAETASELFNELRSAGGVHPLAQLVCFPAAGQGQDKTFVLVAFSKDLAVTIRRTGTPVPKEFLVAEKAPVADRFLMQWAYDMGVALRAAPETLAAVAGSNGTIWSAEVQVPNSQNRSGQRLVVQMVFSPTGRYSRNVLVDGIQAKSIHGRCEPI